MSREPVITLTTDELALAEFHAKYRRGKGQSRRPSNGAEEREDFTYFVRLAEESAADVFLVNLGRGAAEVQIDAGDGVADGHAHAGEHPQCLHEVFGPGDLHPPALLRRGAQPVGSHELLAEEGAGNGTDPVIHAFTTPQGG